MAALLAGRLGIDALWVRLGFVLLALAGGVGLLVYGGLWLVLIAGRDATVPRVLGAVVLLAILPLALNAGSFELMTGPAAIVILLVGLALALWQPRSADPVELTPGPPIEPSAAPVARLDRRPRPPRSILGRATLGLAIVVAAGGALVDEANGARLHPEQWLGAAAVVCGLGLLVGAVRGQAQWLAVPAIVFAGAGFVAAPMARLGIDTGELVGSEYLWIGEDTPGGALRHDVAFGDIDVDVTGEPDAPVTVDARVAIGRIRVRAEEAATVEVRTRIDAGTVNTDGDVPVDGVVRLGPDGPPDVIVDARVGRGTITVRQYDIVEAEAIVPPTIPPIVGQGIDVGPLTPVADDVAATSDGWLVLASGSVVIDATDQVIVGESYPGAQGVMVVPTPVGDFQLLPRSLLITPFGEVLDLQAIRAELAAPGLATTPPAVDDEE